MRDIGLDEFESYVDELVADGLVGAEGDMIWVTDKGREEYDVVMSRLGEKMAVFVLIAAASKSMTAMIRGSDGN